MSTRFGTILRSTFGVSAVVSRTEGNQMSQLSCRAVAGTLFLGALVQLSACVKGESTVVDTGPFEGVGSTVTLGVFTQDESGEYVKEEETLVIEVGVDCYSWDRSTKEGDQHYNAADSTSYADDTLTWTEFGPEDSQADIDETCAAGKDGVLKSANWTDYTADKQFFLQIVDVVETAD